MDFSLILSSGSLVISLGAVLISFWSYKKSGQFAAFEFATRLELENENNTSYTNSFPQAFQYSADIVNNGLKPAEILKGWISYGSRDGSHRVRQEILGQTHVPPGEKRSISFNITWEKLRTIMDQKNLKEVHFDLEIDYRTYDESSKTTKRPLITLGLGRTTAYAHKGSTL